MVLLESLILFSILILLIYKWSTVKYGALKERNIPHLKPWPLVGNMNFLIFLGKRSMCKFLVEIHEKFRNEKVYGIYSMRDPLIMIKDGELIKKICIKDFDNFINHGQSFPEDNSDFGRCVLVLKDQRWKRMRNTLTPTFTGSKMRLMFELANECSIEGVKYLEAQFQNNIEMAEYELEMKDFFTRFTNDVIASTAFGYKVNSFENKQNDFYNLGIKMTQFNGFMFFKFMFACAMPKLFKALGISMFDRTKLNYFSHLVLDAMKQREENKIIRPDMIHLLMEAKKQSKNLNSTAATEQQLQAELTDRDIVAQCLLFFFAGFEPVSTFLCFTLHELMENSDIQDKLYAEIIDMERELQGAKLNYDALKKMKYLDMVISESLRKWPPSIFADRGCSNDYDLIDDEGNFIAQLKKGDNIWVPIISIHRDPDNFANPTKFDPERFSDENKSKIKPFTYIPFGIGPRNCIGNRFALMETKSIIYHIILRFKIYPTARTAKDLLSSMKGFQMMPKENFWFKITKRAE